MTVDCEQAANLISSRLDGELGPADVLVLDAHLAGCAECRATLETTELQDAALVRAFADERDVAAALASHVGEQASAFGTPLPAATNSLPRHGWIRRIGWVAAAAAAGFMGAVVLLRPADRPTAPPPPPPLASAVPAEPVAHLSLMAGDVFTCPSHETTWRPMARGAGLAPGAKVRTAAAAKCELALPGGTRLRLNGDTELQVSAAGDVELAGGQIWSAVPRGAEPLQIAAGHANVRTADAGGQFDVACAANDAATVTVVEGSARVNSKGRVATVNGGESLRLGAIAEGTGSLPALACTPAVDPDNATRWLDDLLVLMPPDDPELLARVDVLLTRIVAERSRPPAATRPGSVERDVRARGQAWGAAIARYAVGNLSAPAQTDVDRRRTAVRLLADVGPPACVPDLITLLDDDDGEVRLHAAAALNRLTGETLGFSPEACASSPRDPAPAAAWQAWWARHRATYLPSL